MTLTTGEAEAVNVLLAAVTGRAGPDGTHPDLRAQQRAVDLLLTAAHAVLPAGLLPGDVRLAAPLAPPPRSDAEHLAAAAALVRAAHPDAAALLLETADQGHHGFWLTDVRLTDGRPLSTVDPAALSRLADAADEHLGELGWDGVVGEDAHGYASVPLAAASG